MEVNGGAQFRRLLYEIELYFRFLDIHYSVTEGDVAQSRGVSTSEISWLDSIVKLIRMHAPVRMKRAIAYVAERLRWFFVQQKDAILQFMLDVKNSCDSHLYSRLLLEKGSLMRENETIKRLIYAKFDEAVGRHNERFDGLLIRTIESRAALFCSLSDRSSYDSS